MKKSYYVTLVAVGAIALLQAIYVMSLYNRYIDEKITSIDETLSISLDKEQHLRSLRKGGQRPQKQQYLSVKLIEDMSPQEVDSLTQLHPLPSSELYNIDSAREKGIVSRSTELMAQVGQDRLLRDGFPLDLKTLDSIFIKDIGFDYLHAFLYYNSNKEVLDSIGKLTNDVPDYTSKLIPLGTKGLQYLQIKADIPLLPFIKNQVWALLLSVILMIFVVLCMAYHLIVIRRKDVLLQKREDTINGTIHDLKSPLNSVVTTLGWLESGEANIAKKRALEISKAEVKHLVCNIESLLVTVRKDRKRLVLKKEDIDILHLAEIVKSNMDVLYSAKPHSIEIVSELPEGVKISADGMYIENVIRNLVENALKYSDDGVAVKVTLSVTGRILQVSVQDNGWGIAPAYQKKLFQQFYQVPRGEERIRKGYGIGLAQSKYIIDEHGGKIAVKSAEGEGSVFAFTIPLV
ncbi:sensor histidine kinase [Bacteroides fluxus]|uniref:sensor histidine kinase n=1 Tax=Bacteroides fluxus TaxID=626930 RepID=UPI0023541261|nr:HAMP domain-containing sensor histidine kinase [Bacteroides fluxus]